MQIMNQIMCQECSLERVFKKQKNAKIMLTPYLKPMHYEQPDTSEMHMKQRPMQYDIHPY